MTKLQIISDKNKKSAKIKKLLVKKLNQEQFNKANAKIERQGFVRDSISDANVKMNKLIGKIKSGDY